MTGRRPATYADGASAATSAHSGDAAVAAPPVTAMAVPDAGSQTASPELPAENSCGRLRPQPAKASNTAPCQILPVLNLGYHLDTDATNTGGKPLQKLDLTVGHQSFDGIGSQADITAATVSVSYDNGKTWTDTHVAHTGCGHFEAHWKNSASHETTPWLRVTARDTIGGTISQTVQDAYTIG